MMVLNYWVGFGSLGCEVIFFWDWMIFGVLNMLEWLDCWRWLLLMGELMGFLLIMEWIVILVLFLIFGNLLLFVLLNLVLCFLYWGY